MMKPQAGNGAAGQDDLLSRSPGQDGQVFALAGRAQKGG